MKEMNATRVRIDLEDGPLTGAAAVVYMGSTEVGRIPRYDVGSIYWHPLPRGTMSRYRVVDRIEGDGRVTLRCKFVGYDAPNDSDA
jgi:hypothetical protein